MDSLQKSDRSFPQIGQLKRNTVGVDSFLKIPKTSYNQVQKFDLKKHIIQVPALKKWKILSVSGKIISYFKNFMLESRIQQTRDYLGCMRNA